jgi:UDP-3-O-acyl-N-acetylglucosamine deacetylase
VSIPTIEEVDDQRLQQLLDVLMLREGGAFCNNAIMVDEVRSMAIELLRYRDRPLHCPGCDGDHL